MRIVVIGSGLAGVTVAEALAKGPRREVCIVTAESHGYYSRPRLSHGFSTAANIVLKGFAAMAPVRVLAGTHVEAIDRDQQRLVLDNGEALEYDILILAPDRPRAFRPCWCRFGPSSSP